MKLKDFLKLAAIIVAATIGDGIFALPYVFTQAGWALCLFYLALFASLVIVAHIVYLKTLEKVGEKERLLGLAKRYLGTGGFWAGFVAIVIGLLLTLVVFLILGSRFIQLGVPWMPSRPALLLFWLFISLSAIAADGWAAELELTGVAVTSFIILFIFLSGLPDISLHAIPAVNAHNFFLPFGAILFSLAGWTGIEPAYELYKKVRRGEGAGVSAPSDAGSALAFGTIFAAVLSALFVAGILGTAVGVVAPDTVSGLANWASWKREFLALLGLFAVWTVSIPIGRELKNALRKDLRWRREVAGPIVIFAPIVLILLGFNDFMVIVGVVGGLFLSMQYLLIVLIGRRALTLSPAKKFLLDLVAVAFIVAAIYSVYAFVVH